MEINIESGNLNRVNEENPERRGWVVGSYIEKSLLRNTNVCEVKYVHHPKGLERRSGANFEIYERTLVILISGKFQIVFDESREFTLENEGDYLIFDTKEHVSKALEGCHLVIVRWREPK